MNPSQRTLFARNSLYLSFSGLAYSLLMYLFVVLVARRLGVEQFGLFSVVTALAIAARTVFDIGLGSYAQRELAARPDQAGRLLWNMIGLKAALFLLYALVLLVYTSLVHYSPATRACVFIVIFMEGAQSYANFLRSVFRAFQRMEYEAVIWVAEGAVTLCGGWALLSVRPSLVLVFWFLSAVALTKMAACLWASHRLVVLPWRERQDHSWWLRITKGALPFGILVALGMIYFRVDTIILGQIKGDTAAGLYGSAYKIFEVLIIVVDAVWGVLFPLLSAICVSDLPRARRVAGTAVKYVLCYAVFAALITGAFAPQFVQLIFGGQYLAAAPLLRVLVVTLVVRSVLSIYLSLFFAAKQEASIIWAYLAVTAFNIALNLLAIPVWGAPAAAVTTVVTEVLFLAITAAVARGKGLQLSWLGHLPKVAVLAMIVGLVILLTRQWGAPVSAMLATAAFAMALAGLRLVDLRELRAIIFGGGAEGA